MNQSLVKINTVHNCSCEEALSYVDPCSIDLILFSPPYARMRKYGHDDAQCDPVQYVKWMLPKFNIFDAILKDTGSIVMNINDCVVDGFKHNFMYDLISAISRETKLKRFDTLFWNKSCSPPTSKRFRDTVEYIHWFAKAKDFKLRLDKIRQPYKENSLKRFKSKTRGRTSKESQRHCPDCNSDLQYINNMWKCQQCEYVKKDIMKFLEPNKLGALPSTLLNLGPETKESHLHPAMYPIAFAEYFINAATDIGDLVLDPFCGSGTTPIACRKLLRNYIGFEIVEKHYQTAINRIKSYESKTSNTASIF